MKLVDVIQLTNNEGANLFTLVFDVDGKEIKWTTSSTKIKDELRAYLEQDMENRSADKVCVVMKYVDKDGDICFVFTKDYCASINSDVVSFATGNTSGMSSEAAALRVVRNIGVQNVSSVKASPVKVAYSTEGMTEDNITMVEVRVADEDLENNPNLVVVKAKDLPSFLAQNEFSTKVANYLEPYLQVMDLEDVASVADNNNDKLELISVEQLTNERFLNKYKLIYKDKKGNEVVHYTVSRRKKEDLEKFLKSGKNERRADTVTVVPKYIDKDGDECIIFIKERRFPVAGDVYAFPAGLVEPGEDGATSAARELAEEIGASKIGELKPFKVGMSYNAEDMTEESVAMFETTIKEMKEQDLQDEEQIDIMIVKVKDLPEFVKGKTLSAKAAAYVEAYLKTLEYRHEAKEMEGISKPKDDDIITA